jgi:acetyltransferase-like isoleucine patch superfamily enzyme
MELAPIVLFVYNRPWHTQQTIEALQKNDLAKDSILYIYSDGAKNQAAIENVLLVREYIKSISGFIQITIIKREKNWGLANNVIDGVTKVVNQHGKVIVLEDDIVTTCGFLKYMNEALSIYENEKRISQISGYIYPNHIKIKEPIVFLNIMACWGWATWLDRWNLYEHNVKRHLSTINTENQIKQFNIYGAANFYQQLLSNLNGEIYTWAVRWYASWFTKDMLSIFPSKSLITNIGDDDTGIHSKKSNKSFRNETIEYIVVEKRYTIHENIAVKKAINHFFKIQLKKQTKNNSSFILKISRSLLYRLVPESRILFSKRISWDSLKSTESNSILGNQVRVSHPYHISESNIGDFTYISSNSHISKTTIGKFCSIGPNLTCGWGLHPTNGISTHPMFYSVAKQNGMTLCNANKIDERKSIVIGNDVFIGANVTILDGVNIGDGSVIGAGAVVSKDIPAYAIAAGVPIKL